MAVADARGSGNPGSSSIVSGMFNIFRPKPAPKVENKGRSTEAWTSSRADDKSPIQAAEDVTPVTTLPGGAVGEVGVEEADQVPEQKKATLVKVSSFWNKEANEKRQLERAKSLVENGSADQLDGLDDDMRHMIEDFGLISGKKDLKRSTSKGAGGIFTSAFYDDSESSEDDESAIDEAKARSKARRRCWRGFRRTVTNPLLLNRKEKFFDWKRRLINPKSSFMVRWDLNTTILLIFTALVTPYEVAFLGSNKLGESVLFWLNRWVDFCFVVDMIFNFFLPFNDPATGNTVTYHRLIWKRYLKLWFWIDLVSIIPFELLSTYFSGLSMLSDMRVLRIIRLAKLAKLLRVVRGLRVFKRWEARMFINYAVLNLFVLFCGICLGTHWLACTWAVLVDMEGEPWESSFTHIDDDSSAFSRFVACLYWSVGMVTSLGDPNALSITTDLQRVAYILACLSAGIANAYLIGGVVSLLERMNERKSEFYRAMDILNEFLKERGLSSGRVYLQDGKEIDGKELCERLRTYYIFKHSQGSTSDNFHEILFTCSKFMQSAIATKMHADALRQVSYFENASKSFITLVSCNIKSVIFAAQEKVFEKDDSVDCLYIVERGCVFSKGNVVRQNQAFGEEVFYRYEKGCTRGYMAVTLTESVLQYVAKEILLEAVMKYGDWRMRVRMKCNSAVLKLARTTKRAAIVAMSTRDFSEGYEVLATEYKEELLQVKESPIIETWKAQVEVLIGTMQRDGEELYVKVTTQKRGRKEPATRVLTIQEACTKYFDMLARRATVREDLLNQLDLHKMPLKQFLSNTELFDGHEMGRYQGILVDQKLSIDMLQFTSATDLSIIGIPLGDAIRIVRGAKEHLGLDLDDESFSNASQTPSRAGSLQAKLSTHDEKPSPADGLEQTGKRGMRAKMKSMMDPSFELETFVLERCLEEEVMVAVTTGNDSFRRDVDDPLSPQSDQELITQMLATPSLGRTSVHFSDDLGDDLSTKIS